MGLAPHEILIGEAARIIGVTHAAVRLMDAHLQPRRTQIEGKSCRVYDRAIVEAFAARRARVLAERENLRRDFA